MKETEKLRTAIFAVMDCKDTDPDVAFDTLRYLFDRYNTAEWVESKEKEAQANG